MKICLLSNFYPPFQQGDAEIYVMRLAEELATDHQVVVITSEPGRHLEPRREVAGNRTVVYRLAPLNLGDLSDPRPSLISRAAFRAIDFYHPQVAASVRAIIAREMPDVVHLHNWVGLSLAAVLSSLKGGRFDRLPVAITPHDYSLFCAYGDLRHPSGTGCPPGYRCRALGAVNRSLTRSVGLVLSPSRYALELHRERGFFPQAEAAVLPYGLSHTNPVPAGPGPRARQTYNVLFLDRVDEHSGSDTLVRAFRALTEPTLRLHVAGEGPLLARCRQLADGDPRIFFDHVPSLDARRELLDGADCLVVPTRWPANSPLSILEAFQSATVVIASRTGGIPEMVRDGVNGLLVEPGVEAAIGSSIMRLRRDPELQVRLTNEAGRAARLYDMAFHASNVVGAYRRLIATNRATPLTGKAA